MSIAYDPNTSLFALLVRLSPAEAVIISHGTLDEMLDAYREMARRNP